MNVSHTPIREALGRLEGEGLVVKTHLIGYSAAPQISRRRFDELYELRLLLEPDAAPARRARDGRGAATRSCASVAGVMSRRAGGDERLRYSAFARQDAIFHDMIMEFAGNELVRETLAHQHTHFHIFRLMFHSRVTEEALRRARGAAGGLREAAMARRRKQAMRDHIERSRDRLLPAFD